MSNQGAPTVSPSQVTAAGLASAGAAAVTSFAGIAGTLIGAALTAMIVTGASAILRAYLESAAGRVREVPSRLRVQGDRRGAVGRGGPSTIPGRPDLRENFMGRLRAATDWFSRLSPLNRRSILVKGLLTGAVAFVIGMSVVTVAEAGVLRNTLSCGLWSQCEPGAAPGFGGGNAAHSTVDRLFQGAGGGSPGGLPGFPGGDQPPAVRQQY